MEKSSGVLNAQEAALFLGAHVETVRRLARRGAIPAFKVGKDWRFKRETLDRWAEEGHQRRKPPCILVVENDPAVRGLIGLFLERDGYRVCLAANGKEGLALLENDHIHLILLDLKMPVMNGPEFLRRLMETDRRLPVIVVTGYPDSDLMVEAMAYGPMILVAKPVDRALLMEAVRTILNGALAEQAGNYGLPSYQSGASS
ncbi:MAG: response regulator [Proteobacteria bacterium]|nr:response regulator [Pseudomonadota bacterium]